MLVNNEFRNLQVGKKTDNNYMGKNGYNFERVFVDVIIEMLNDRRKGKTEFSRVVFAEQSKPDNKWQRIIKADNRNGMPQKVNLENVYDIAVYFGYDPHDLIQKIYSEYKKRFPGPTL